MCVLSKNRLRRVKEAARESAAATWAPAGPLAAAELPPAAPMRSFAGSKKDVGSRPHHVLRVPEAAAARPPTKPPPPAPGPTSGSAAARASYPTNEARGVDEARAAWLMATGSRIAGAESRPRLGEGSDGGGGQAAAAPLPAPGQPPRCSGEVARCVGMAASPRHRGSCTAGAWPAGSESLGGRAAGGEGTGEGRVGGGREWPRRGDNVRERLPPTELEETKLFLKNSASESRKFTVRSLMLELLSGTRICCAK